MGAAVLLLLFGSVVSAFGFRPTDPDEKPIAIGGFDPVACLVDRKLVRGSAFIEYEEPATGLVWRFSRRSYIELYVALPVWLRPELVGEVHTEETHLAWTEVEAKRFAVEGGKVYFFTTDEIRRQWLADDHGQTAVAEVSPVE